MNGVTDISNTNRSDLDIYLGEEDFTEPSSTDDTTISDTNTDTNEPEFGERNGPGEATTDTESNPGDTTTPGETDTTELTELVISPEQLEIVTLKMDNLIDLTADLVSYGYILTTVVIPLIAIICLLWWFARQFFPGA